MSSILSTSYGYPVITNILENISPNYNPNLYLLSIFREERNVTTVNYRFRFDSQFVSQFEERKGRRRLDSNIERGHEAVIKFSIVASTECESWAVKLRDKGGRQALWGRAKRRKREKFSQGRRRVLVKIRRGGRRRRRRRVPRVGT